MARIADVAAADVRSRLYGGGREGAHTVPFVVGRTRSVKGRQWAVTARVSVLTEGQSGPEAVRTLAIAAGRHLPVTSAGRHIGTTRGAEGRTHAFRDAAKAIEDAAQANVSTLIEGLN